jgi:hypothetical protein
MTWFLDEFFFPCPLYPEPWPLDPVFA